MLGIFLWQLKTAVIDVWDSVKKMEAVFRLLTSDEDKARKQVGIHIVPICVLVTEIFEFLLSIIYKDFNHCQIVPKRDHA